MAWIESRLSDGGSSGGDIDGILDGSIENLTSSATTVRNNLFYNCTNLLSVSLPNATSIGIASFDGCTKLADVYLPNVITIENTAFRKSKIQSIILDKATSIGQNVFSNVSVLDTVVLKSNTMCALGPYSFSYTKFASGTSGGKLYVPQNLISEYQADTNWSTVINGNPNNQILPIEGSIYE